MQKTASFAWFCLMVLAASHQFPLANASNGKQCWRDSDCSPTTYCLNGYCDGDCVVCDIFQREESASGCAKQLINCGSCRPGTQEEDLVGGGKSDRCKPIGTGHSDSPPAIEAYANLSHWRDWAIMVLSFAGIVTIIVVYIFFRHRVQLPTFFRRGKPTPTATAPTLWDLNEVEGFVENHISSSLPLVNLNLTPTTGYSESENHVQAQPFNAISDNMSEDLDDFTDASFSNRQLDPRESLNHNDISGTNQDVYIDLSIYRNAEFSSISNQDASGNETHRLSLPFISVHSESSNDYASDSNIEVFEDEDEGSVVVSGLLCVRKTPQQPRN